MTDRHPDTKKGPGTPGSDKNLRKMYGTCNKKRIWCQWGIFVENILCFNVFIDSQKLCKQCNLDTFSFLRQSFCGFRKLRKPPLGCMTRNNVFEIFEWVKRAKNVDIHCGCFYPKCSKFLAVQNSSIGDLVTN